jgi:hypothetical protein
LSHRRPFRAATLGASGYGGERQSRPECRLGDEAEAPRPKQQLRCMSCAARARTSNAVDRGALVGVSLASRAVQNAVVSVGRPVCSRRSGGYRIGPCTRSLSASVASRERPPSRVSLTGFATDRLGPSPLVLPVAERSRRCR